MTALSTIRLMLHSAPTTGLYRKVDLEFFGRIRVSNCPSYGYSTIGNNYNRESSMILKRIASI
jgi:hypothetical protein